MRFKWLKDQQELNNFDVYWATSQYIESDYYTKRFTAQYHRTKRPKHVLDKQVNH